MTEPTVGATETPIPTCITKCCREWVSPPPGLYGRGKCGLCGESPEFVRMLPRSEWVTPRPPIRPAAAVAESEGA